MPDMKLEKFNFITHTVDCTIEIYIPRDDVIMWNEKLTIHHYTLPYVVHIDQIQCVRKEKKQRERERIHFEE